MKARCSAETNGRRRLALKKRSGGEAVIVVQTKDATADQPDLLSRRGRGGLPEIRSGIGDSVDALMGPGVVVVIHVAAQDMAQVPWAPEDEMVKTLVLEGADGAFGVGVGLGGVVGGGDALDVHDFGKPLVQGAAVRCCGGPELSVNAVVVMNQEFGMEFPAANLADGLLDEVQGGMAGDTGVNDFTATQMKEDEDVDGFEKGGVPGEEIAAENPFGFLAKEGTPLAGGRGGRPLQSVFADGVLGDGETKFEEFAAKAFVAPAGVFEGKGADEGDEFGSGGRTAPGRGRGLGFVGPEAFEEAAVKPWEEVRA